MPNGDLAATFARFAEARTAVLPSGIELAAALGNVKAAAALQQRDFEQRLAADRLRRDRFYADARWLGIHPSTAEQILTLAHSDQVRYGQLTDPYTFAYAVLAVVEPLATPDS